MSIATLIRAMGKAGATIEAIALAVEALEAGKPRTSSAERMARKRERDKSVTCDVTGDAYVTECDVTSDASPSLSPSLPLPPNPQPPPTHTPAPASDAPVREGTPQARAMAAVLGEALEARGVRAPRRKPRCQTPDSWSPTDAGCRYAVERGMPSEEIETQVEKFLNYHKSRGTMHGDIDAAWRTWAGNFNDFRRTRHINEHPGFRPAKPSTDERLERSFDAAQAMLNRYAAE